MSPLGWVVVAILAAAVVWLGLALLGAVRELAAIRERLDAMQADAASIEDGLPVGTPAPAWEIVTPEGETVSSSSLRGRRHLLVFADADCAACDELVPSVVRAAEGDRLPPVAVIGRGEARATPEAWRARDGRAVVGAERADHVTTAYEVRLSPHVFVIDDGGFVVAHGVAADLADVRSMLRGSEGIRIVAGGEPS